MKHLSAALRLLFSYLLLVALPACGDGPSGPPTPVAIVKLSQDSATLVPGASVDVSATPQDAQGQPLTRPIIWTSSDASVASVANGRVTALTPGTAVISAVAAGTTGSITVVVKDGGLVGPGGGIITAANGRVSVIVPPGSASAQSQLVVESISNPVASTRLVSGSAYGFDAGSVSFSQPLTISLRYEASSLKTGAPEAGLKLYQLVNGLWARVTSSFIDLTERRVSATVSSLGTFAILEQAPATAAINTGNNQTAVVATLVAVAPSLKVIDSEGFPVPGLAVQFAVSADAGSITGASATTSPEGIAMLGGWTLGTAAGTNTLTAAIEGAAGGPFTFSATAVPAAPSKLVMVVAPPATAQSGLAWSAQPAVKITDVFGNNVAAAGVTVTAALVSGAGTLTGTTSNKTDVTGAVTFPDLVLSGTAGTKSVSFTSLGLTPVSATIALLAGTPRSIAAAAGDNQTAIAGAVVATVPAVRVRDADGNPVAGVAVTFAVTSGGGSISGAASAVTDALGEGRIGSWTLGTIAGPNTLGATAAGLSGSPVTFTASSIPGEPVSLGLVTAASTSPQSRIAFPQQPSVRLYDINSNAVSRAGIPVTASIASGGGTLSGTVTIATKLNGVAQFEDLAIAGTVGPRTLSFAGSGMPAVTASVTLTSGTPSSLSGIAGDAQTARAGGSVTTAPSVRVADADGNAVAGVSVTFAVTSGSGSVTGATAISDALGEARVGSWTLGSTAATNTLTASASSVAGSPVVFTATGTAGDPARLGIVTAPTGSPQNRIVFPQQPAVQLYDSNNNAVARAGVPVGASIISGGGTLSGTLIVSTDARGVAQFTDLAIAGTVGPRMLNFGTSASTTVGTSVILVAGNAAALASVAGNSQTARVGAAVSIAPTVRATDSDGNAVAGVPVTFSVTAGGGSITGSSAITDALGDAHVGSWTLGPVSGTNTLIASGAGLAGSPVTFTATSGAGTPSRTVLTTSPTASPRSRILFPQQPVLQIQDAGANVVAQPGLAVTASLIAGSGTLIGTTTVNTDATGMAHFTDLGIAGAAGAKTLSFALAGTTAATISVTLTAGLPAAITAVAGDAQSANAGTAVVTPPTVRITDADGNPVAGITVTFAVASGGGSILGGAAATDALGIAKPASWTLGQTAGTNTLTAQTPGVTAVPVFTATGVPGDPVSVAITSGNEQSAAAGRGLRAAIVFRVADAFGNAVPNVQLNFAAASGSGAISPATATTSSSGLATLRSWQLGPVAGNQSVTATVNGRPGVSASGSATAVTVRVVTFGDSNTDYGYVGISSQIGQVSYISANPSRPNAYAANSSTQLAGKIAAQWASAYSPAITTVNHAVLGTSSGSSRSTEGAPGARSEVRGVTRFGAEVLGQGYLWNGGEPSNSSFSVGIDRLQAFTPTVNDFVYVSIGTNDGGRLITSAQTIDNLSWMIDQWEAAGLPANHFILTNLPPAPGQTELEADRNRSIRALAAARRVGFIDVSAHTSDDDGITWKSASMHVGDAIHYNEPVRDWIAQQVVAIMASVTQPLP